MPIFDLYGFKTENLDLVKDLIERYLCINFEPHESSYRGGDYYCFENNDFDLELQNNIDLIDNEPLEHDFGEYKIILYASFPSISKKITETLTSNPVGGTFLKREKL